MNFRTCSNPLCKEPRQPETTEFFYRRSADSPALQSECILCQRERHRQDRQRREIEVLAPTWIVTPGELRSRFGAQLRNGEGV